jgi:E3 ubiquitin-protein ligase CHFR
MEKSDECPICRLKVTRISKNHIVNNLIDAYLKNNPDKKRSEEEILKLNQKNKITKDIVYIIQFMKNYALNT